LAGSILAQESLLVQTLTHINLQIMLKSQHPTDLNSNMTQTELFESAMPPLSDPEILFANRTTVNWQSK
jgi:hypothetical protein